jgi:hypothetical protein
MRRTGYLWIGVLTLAAACATAPLPPPRTLAPGDLKALAGRWEASATTVEGRRVTAIWDIREDGTVAVNSGGRIADARVSIRDGKAVLDGAFTDAVLTLHEGGGRRVLRGTGQFRGIGVGGQSQIEAVQVK